MNPLPTRIDLKLTLITLVCMILLGAAAAALVIGGFEQTRSGATQRSANALEEQGRIRLERQVQREAAVSTDQLREAAALGATAAEYMQTMRRLDASVPGGVLVRGPNGQLLDPRPARPTELFVPAGTPDDIALERDLRDSTALDALFPALLRQYPDAVAISYISPRGLTRSFPVLGRSPGMMLPADYNVLNDPRYRLATPVQNPTRTTVWRWPYADPSGQGLLVTASTPVYGGDSFRGVIAVDISLTRLIERLSSLQPVDNGYAFLIDQTGRLIAAPSEARMAIAENAPPVVADAIDRTLGPPLTSLPDRALQDAFQAMRRGETDVRRLELAGRTVFLAYAPVGEVGWSLGLVAPVDAITAQALEVERGIARDADNTVRFTLLAMCVCFLLALIATTLLSRRMLTRPIDALLSGTRAVAAGRLDVVIKPASRDELGMLATSFNQMTRELAASRDRLEQRSGELQAANQALQAEVVERQRVTEALREKEQQLEQRVEERTRELSTLLATAHSLAATLDLQPLLTLILARLRDVVDYSAAALFQLEDSDVLLLRRYLGPIPQERLVERWPLDRAGHSREVVRSRAPVVIPDVRADTPLARAFRAKAIDDLGEVPEYIASWMGVPLLLGDEVIGVLAFDHGVPGFYTQRDAELAQAFAAQATVAIENARLYRRAQQLAALQERQRLARELHDSVSQALFGIALGARTARALVERDPARAAEPIDYVLSLAEAGLAEMRALIFELRPESLEQEGLVAALTKQTAALRARHSLAVQTALCDEPELPLEAKEVLYRVAQEAMHNVVKHARASRVDVRLDCGPCVVLEVRDDGQGFDPQGSFPGHLGLKSMRERAERLGGRVTIQSAPGQGTTVRAELPVGAGR
ncbi:MAG: hypothetical protein OHK0022_40520 [Roseiflexaceae bacterium]